MGAHNHLNSFLLLLPQFFENQIFIKNIERGTGFIQQPDSSILHRHLNKANQLPLPSGKSVGPGMLKMPKLIFFQ